MRILELSWKDLEKLLLKGEKEDNALNEEIKEITLMKPRIIRIYLERR